VSRFILSSHRRMSCILSANSGTRNLHIEKKKEKKRRLREQSNSAIGNTPYNHVRSMLEEINIHTHTQSMNKRVPSSTIEGEKV
jgi:hypothetical protein